MLLGQFIQVHSSQGFRSEGSLEGLRRLVLEDAVLENHGEVKDGVDVAHRLGLEEHLLTALLVGDVVGRDLDVGSVACPGPRERKKSHRNIIAKVVARFK